MNSPSFESLFFSKVKIAESLLDFKKKNLAKAYVDNPKDQIRFSDFLIHQDEFIELIFSALKKGDFQFQPARQVTLSLDKPRLAYRFEWPEKFLLSHFAKVLYEQTKHLLPESLYSYRHGRSRFDALQKTAEFLRSPNEKIYILRQDIKKYTDSIDHDVLIEDFKKWTNGSPLSSLLAQICKFEYLDTDGKKNNQVGLPAGTYVNVVFMNLYLVPLDNFLNQLPESFYVRFADDLFFATKNYESLKTAERNIESLLKSRCLEINHSKTRKIVFGKPHKKTQFGNIPNDFSFASSIEYLGMKIEHDGTLGLPQTKLKKMRDYLVKHLLFVNRNFANEKRSKKLSALVSAVRGVFNQKSLLSDNSTGTRLHAVTNHQQLKDLDRWVAQLIHKQLGLKGFKKGNFKHLSFSDLRAAGLPSLVHLRRTHGL